MNKRKIDLSQYEQNNEEFTIRKVFNNDEDLRLILSVIYVHQPIILPHLKNKFNNIRKAIHSKQYFFSKLNKISPFGLVESKWIGDCKPNGNETEKWLLNKHNEFVESVDVPFKNMYSKCIYYYLTEKGEEWINEIQEIQKKYVELINKK